jgi:hypothetical protein
VYSRASVNPGSQIRCIAKIESTSNKKLEAVKYRKTNAFVLRHRQINRCMV